ncbi:ABC-type cobalamin/Fe3+-siderophores transport system ATPase subunit [Pedobacter cryoconitis]|nr:ABC-type cobalamin/Fe3+-siderophores transport system ATPase subunit [Pedobacter cryoconitis]
MNKLEFKDPYLSITTFNSIKLNSLTILTGLNGSGKSHLLQSILNGSSTIDDYKPNDIRYFA